MKKILIVLVVLAAAGAAGLFLLLGGLGSVIKTATEKFGSDATQAKVTLNSADVSLSSGEGTLKGLVVGNPEGFATPSAFELGEVSVKLDTSSLTTDTIVVKEVVIHAPKVTYELNGSLSSNLSKIQSNVDEYTRRLTGGLAGGGKGDGSGGGKGGGKGDGTGGGKADSGGKKFVIETLRVEGGRVQLSATIAKGGSIGADIAPIEMHDIGKADGGASPGQIAGTLLDVLVKSSLDAVTKSGIAKQATDLIGGTLGKATDAVKGLFGGSGDETEKKKGAGKGK